MIIEGESGVIPSNYTYTSEEEKKGQDFGFNLEARRIYTRGLNMVTIIIAAEQCQKG